MAYRKTDIPPFTKIAFENLANEKKFIAMLNREMEQWIRSKRGVDDLVRRIRKVTGFSETHARTIARTERTRVQGKARHEAIRQANASRPAGQKALKKQWVARRDNRTRDSHAEMSGQVQWNDQYFVSGAGNKLMYPGDLQAPASEVINCRCYIRKTTQDVSKELRNLNQSSIIEIDELTPCLRRTSDGQFVNTTVERISPSRKEFQEWEFDWSRPEKNGFIVHAIKVDGDDRVQGLVAWKPDKANSAVMIDIVEAAPFNNPHNKLYSAKEYTGVGGHLFAEAVNQSYKHGYDGFVFFVAKTKLIEHYEKEMGAVLVNPKTRIMMIDERAAKTLYDKYYRDE